MLCLLNTGLGPCRPEGRLDWNQACGAILPQQLWLRLLTRLQPWSCRFHIYTLAEAFRQQ